MRDAWDAVLDDLDERLTAAEAGDLARLTGWSVPSVRPGPGADLARAAGLVRRQQALAARLREERARTGAALGALRRRSRRPAVASAVPVYLDRLG